MLSFLVRRLIQALPVLLLSSIIVFFIIYLVPGDPALVLAGPDPQPEVVEALRERLGLDRPVPVQYLSWLGSLLGGDLGTSYVTGLPVREVILNRMPATLQLASSGLVIATIIGVSTGIISALRENRPVDWVISSTNATMIAIPNFWIGILAILLFAVNLGWLPPGGHVAFGVDPVLALKSLALPAFAIAINATGILSRFTKSAMLDTLHEDYVRTAESKGLTPFAVVVKHSLRNALIPVITMMGILAGRMIGGAIVIESVFAWPGLGRLLVQSISNRDYSLVQGVLLLLVFLFLFVNLIVDLLYGVLDPRIRVSEARTASA